VTNTRPYNGVLAVKCFMILAPEAEFWVGCQGYLQLVSSLSPLANELLEEFFVGRELKLLSHKVHAHLNDNSCLGCSQMTKNTKKAQTYTFTTHA